MLITFDHNYKDQWACFELTDCNGERFHVDIVPFSNLTKLDGVTVPPNNPVFFMTVLGTDEDRVKLADRMIGKRHDLEWRIIEIVKSWHHGNRRQGKPVRCIDTGEIWSSVAECARQNGLSHSHLHAHLHKFVGQKSVKGRRYEWA